MNTQDNNGGSVAQAKPDEIDEIRAMFSEYVAWLGVDLSFQQYDAELSSLPGRYAPPSGRLLLARHNGLPAGCACLRKLSATRCELKRLYVREAFRKQGVGALLTHTALTEARLIGYREIVLDTLGSMRPAIALYQNLGFEEIPPYYTNPLAGAHFFMLKLFPAHSH